MSQQVPDDIFSGTILAFIKKMKRSIGFTLAFCLLLPTSILAKDYSLLLVSNADKTYVNDISQNLINNLADSNIRIRTANNHNESITDQYDLIVTIGSQLAHEALQDTSSETPVFSLLIPEQIATHINPGNSRTWAAQVIDQPFKRQLQLIKVLIGSNKKTGVILGPASSVHKRDIERTSKETGIAVNYEIIETSDMIIPALKKALEENDIILSIPDPDVYNKNTIRGILLLTYRNKIPVIGYSKSYIKAGATAGIYSTPDQIANDATKHIKDYFDNGKKFKQKIYYPDSYSLEINKRVASTMQLKNYDKDAIIKQIKSQQ
ncbi:MAG: hypothetical protein OEY61_08060 [Gammaproteobacteria bacterium]|nr:hypothetical protein [Gammaproteobacteria bacterium]